MTSLYHARRRVFRRTLVVTREGGMLRRPYATITRHPLQVNKDGKSHALTPTPRGSWVLHGEPCAEALLTDRGGVITVQGQEFLLDARPQDVVVTTDGEVVGRVAKNLSKGWSMAFADVPDVVVVLSLFVVSVMKPRTR